MDQASVEHQKALADKHNHQKNQQNHQKEKNQKC